MRNFRRVMSGIDVRPLLDQLRDHPELWSTDTEWTRKKRGAAIYSQENIVLRYLTLGLEPGGKLYLYEDDRTRDDWTRPAFRTLSAAQPIVFDLLRAVPGEHLGHVIITRMPPYGEIASHIDQWPTAVCAPYWQRFQVPLSVGSDCMFRCGDEEMWLEPGSAYWFDNQVEHSVRNGGQERISMIVDVRPFQKE